MDGGRGLEGRRHLGQARPQHLELDPARPQGEPAPDGADHPGRGLDLRENRRAGGGKVVGWNVSDGHKAKQIAVRPSAISKIAGAAIFGQW